MPAMSRCIVRVLAAQALAAQALTPAPPIIVAATPAPIIATPAPTAIATQAILCTVAAEFGQNCETTGITLESKKGLCVNSAAPGTGQGTPSCVDICDPSKKVTFYNISVPPASVVGQTVVAVSDVDTALHLLVSEIRDGKNMNIQCCDAPPCDGLGSAFTDWCPPGNTCGGTTHQGAAWTYGSGNSAHAKTVPDGRGMCIVDANGPDGRSCVDMCDYAYTEEKFLGTVNAWSTVQSTRSGSACPHFQLWPIILGLLVCCCISIGIGYYAMVYLRGGRRKGGGAPVRSMVGPEEQDEAPAPVHRGLHHPPPQEVHRELPPLVQEPLPLQPVPNPYSNYQGLDAPQLSMPNVQPVYQSEPLLAQEPYYPQPQAPPQGSAYYTIPTQPSQYSQSAIQQSQLAPAFATQPMLSPAPGSYQQAPGAYYR